jgi:16S rRNA processing protein RimM
LTSWRPERIVIGTIGRAHGLDGSFYLNGYGGAVPIEPGMALRVGEHDAVAQGRKGTTDRPVLRIDLAHDRSAAEALRGLEVTVDAALLPPLDEDEYLHVDLIGCSVVAQERDLGRVTAVHEYPANDVLELDGGEMIPFVEEVVLELDIPGRRIVVSDEVLSED